MKIIRIVCDAAGLPCPEAGQWIRSANVEAHQGRGTVVTTPDPVRAMRFDDAGEAVRFWRSRSQSVPTRPDGGANRPLTAFTVEIEDAP